MATKTTLHPRNQHREGYDFTRLVADTPALEAFTTLNPKGQTTISFQDPMAVRMLNRALLKTHYGVENWDIPENALCPPIPGRVDYIHCLADLLGGDNKKQIPRGPKYKALDIGTGASLVYPLIGQSEYGWEFTGTDIDPVAITSAKQICDRNTLNIPLRLQANREDTLKGAIQTGDRFHVILSNPPFHSSMEEANRGTQRKWRNLGKGKSSTLNFGGQNTELWCPGGEVWFISNMIEQSKALAKQCLWFTSLVSKKDNLSMLLNNLERAGIADFKVVEMAQGQKVSRFIAWTYIQKHKRPAFMNGSMK